MLASGRSVLVMADAGALPWSPYYRRAAVEHTFIVDGIRNGCVLVVDAYESMTEWGPAQPVQGLLRVPALQYALGGRQVAWSVVDRVANPVPLDVPAVLRTNAIRMGGQANVYSRFAEMYRRLLWAPVALDRLNTQVWRLHRKRSAQDVWLRRVAAVFAPPGWLDDFTVLVSRWRRIVETAYLSKRRCLAGKAVPVAVCDQVREVGMAEEALARRLADDVGETGEGGS